MKSYKEEKEKTLSAILTPQDLINIRQYSISSFHSCCLDHDLLQVTGVHYVRSLEEQEAAHGNSDEGYSVGVEKETTGEMCVRGSHEVH